ncbi:MAG: hypothetical protein IKX56_04390 [Muribaculaceae bacterium]|nr:hypothetical protein [Muribaculaceae bacterium]
MKHLIKLLLATLLVACSLPSSVARAESNMGKTLIVYYSFTGNCEAIVNTLASQITADQLEIEPAEKGLDYAANNYALGSALIAAIRQNPNDASSYPAIDPVEMSLDNYQNIIIVTPLWWSNMAAIMQSYLFQYGSQMTGKTVGLIVSSYSSGISSVVADAQRLLPGVTWAGDALWINNSNHSRRGTLIENWLPTQNFQTSTEMTQKLYITIDGVTKSAMLVSNSSTEALMAQLQLGDITYQAHDYGDFEKVGPLGYTFPQNNEQITTVPGDLILYQGSNLCIYYDTNSWNFTRIGKIDNASQEEIKSFVHAGGGDVTVKLSLKDSARPGDVNGDGEVNINDVTKLIDMVLSGNSSSTGDVNGDREVNINDITKLIDIILGKEI